MERATSGIKSDGGQARRGGKTAQAAKDKQKKSAVGRVCVGLDWDKRLKCILIVFAQFFQHSKEKRPRFF